jgi:hypothetical protein
MKYPNNNINIRDFHFASQLQRTPVFVPVIALPVVLLDFNSLNVLASS